MEKHDSSASTPTEQVLTRLCNKTFLNLWSYPNIFRDQGEVAGGGHGKEICDLLVVFGRDVVIFSDKECKMPASGKPDVDWARWFDRAVLRSAKQIYGAERWLRQYPNRVFLDPGCTRRLAAPVPLGDALRVHRVVVASGARDRCREVTGGSGSLAINPALRDDEHAKPDSANYKPFSIGHVDPAKGYVHVVDGATIEVLLGELDTVADFIAYLVAKEQLIAAGKMPFVPSEEAFLAWYLKASFSTPNRTLDVSAVERVTVDPNGWETLSADPIYRRNREQDAWSRGIWDVLIETFTASFLAGIALPGGDVTPTSFEQGLRIMAGEPRFNRFVLSRALRERMHQAAESRQMWRIVLIPDRLEVAYLFYFHRREEGESHEEYTETRRTFMAAHCMVYTWKTPSVRSIVGLGTEAGLNVLNRTWELMCAEQHKPADSDDAELQALQEMLSVDDKDINSQIVTVMRLMPR